MQTAQFQVHAEIECQHWWFVARRRIMRQLVTAVLPASPTTAVLDVGCGTGANLAILANSYRCTGIDSSAVAIAYARQRFPDLEFLIGHAPADMGPRMDSIRLILLMDVLEHVSDDFAMFSELLAASAPGTYFFVTVPADESLWSKHDESFGHYRRYDRGRLERLWSNFPVTPLVISFFNSRLLPFVRFVRGRGQRRQMAAGLADTDFWLPNPVINWTLERIFQGEVHRLFQVLRGRRAVGYRAGASLMALLRREAGPIARRTKPADLPADHQPLVS